MAAIEPALKMKAGELEKYFERPNSYLEGLNDGQRKRIYRHRPALCPLCLKKDGFIRALTDVALLTVCPTHSVILIDSCPGCGDEIDFNRTDLDQCPSCEQPYTHGAFTSLSPSAPATYIARQVSLGKLGLADLLSACDRMARPVDILPAAPVYADMTLSWMHEHLNRAAGLLYIPDFRSGYRDALTIEPSDTSMAIPEAATLPLDRFIKTTKTRVSTLLDPTVFSRVEHFQRFATKSENPAGDAKVLGIPASRLRCWSDHVDSVDLSRQISAELLSDCLGISQHDLLALNTSGILRTINDVRTARHQIFDLNEVVALFQAIPSSAQKENETCTASALRKDLKLFAADYSVLISLILAGEIPSTNNRVAFTNMQFDRNQARLALHKHLLANIEMNGNALAGVMATSNKQLLEAKTQWKRDASGDFQRGALKTWCSLNRVAKMTGKQLRQLRPALERRNIQPAFIVPGAPQDLLVYSLDQNFREAISAVVSAEKYCGF